MSPAYRVTLCISSTLRHVTSTVIYLVYNLNRVELQLRGLEKGIYGRCVGQYIKACPNLGYALIYVSLFVFVFMFVCLYIFILINGGGGGCQIRPWYDRSVSPAFIKLLLGGDVLSHCYEY